MTRAFGIDISKYQSSSNGLKRMDFNAVKAHKEEVTFIVARAGVSWSYKDPMFDYYWSEMRRINVCRMAYHVPYFGESALAQMDSLFKIMEGQSNWAYDRLALDLELEGINTRDRITATTLKCLEICKARTGKFPVLYSRANWVNPHLNVSALPNVDWWLANYNKKLPYPLYTSEHPGPPYLPNSVNNYLIHQTGSTCKSIGTVSYYMDYDRWNGSKADVLNYFGNTGGGNPPPKPLFKAKCIVSALYKRKGPGTGYAVIGSLSMGDVVEVYEVKDNWYRIAANAQVWCSGSQQYMRVLDPELPPGDPTALFKAKCIVSALYKRSGPAPSFESIGYLVRDQIVDVYEVTNNWFRIEPNAQVWCSGYPQYMQKI